MLGAKVVGGSCEYFVWGLGVQMFRLFVAAGDVFVGAGTSFSMKRRTSETCRGTDVVAQSVVMLVS